MGVNSFIHWQLKCVVGVSQLCIMRITRTEGQWRSTRKSRALYTRAETGPQQLEELKLAFR